MDPNFQNRLPSLQPSPMVTQRNKSEDQIEIERIYQQMSNSRNISLSQLQQQDYVRLPNIKKQNGYQFIMNSETIYQSTVNLQNQTKNLIDTYEINHSQQQSQQIKNKANKLITQQQQFQQQQNKQQQQLQGVEFNISMNRPCFVSERKDVNIQSVVLKKTKKKKKKYKGIDNEIDFKFPIHRDKDWIEDHAQGFQNKSNIDLFKHYMRLFMKNKFRILQVRKERAERRKQHKIQQEKEQLNLEKLKSKIQSEQKITSQQRISSRQDISDSKESSQQKKIQKIKSHMSIFSPRTDEEQTKKKVKLDTNSDEEPISPILSQDGQDEDDKQQLISKFQKKKQSVIQSLKSSGSSKLSPKSILSKKSLKREQEKLEQDIINNNPNNPMVKEFVIDKNLADMQMFNQVISLYGDSDKITELKEQYELKKIMGEKTPLEKLMERHYNKLRIVNLYDTVQQNLPSDQIHEQTILTVEEIFIKQIMETVSQFGVNALTVPEKIEFKRVIDRRTDQLTEMKRLNDLDKLTEIKKKLKLKIEQKKEYESSIRSSEPFFGFSKRENFLVDDDDDFVQENNIQNQKKSVSQQHSLNSPSTQFYRSQQINISDQKRYEFQKEQERIKKAYASYRPGLKFQLQSNEQLSKTQKGPKISGLEQHVQRQILKKLLIQQGKYDPQEFENLNLQGQQMLLENNLSQQDISSINNSNIEKIYLEQLQKQQFLNPNNNTQDLVLSPRDEQYTERQQQQLININNISNIEQQQGLNNTTIDTKQIPSLQNLTYQNQQLFPDQNNNNNYRSSNNLMEMSQHSNYSNMAASKPILIPQKLDKKTFEEKQKEKIEQEALQEKNRIKNYYNRQEMELQKLKLKLRRQMRPEMKKFLVESFNQNNNKSFRYKPQNPYYNQQQQQQEQDSLNSTELRSNVNGTQSIIQNNTQNINESQQGISQIFGNSQEQQQISTNNNTLISQDRSYNQTSLFLNENDILDIIIEQTHRQGLETEIMDIISTEREHRTTIIRDKENSQSKKELEEISDRDKEGQEQISQKLSNLIGQIQENLTPDKLKQALNNIEQRQKKDQKILNDSIIDNTQQSIQQLQQQQQSQQSNTVIYEEKGQGYISLEHDKQQIIKQQYQQQQKNQQQQRDELHKQFQEVQEEISYQKLESQIDLQQIQQQKLDQYQKNFVKMDSLKSQDKNIKKKPLALSQQKPKQQIQNYLVDANGKKTQQIIEMDGSGKPRTYSVDAQGNKQQIVEENGKKFILEGAQMLEKQQSSSHQSSQQQIPEKRVEVVSEIRQITTSLKLPNSDKVFEQLVVEENGKQVQKILTDRETNEKQEIIQENNQEFIVQKDGQKIQTNELIVETEFIQPLEDLEQITEEQLQQLTSDRQSQTNFSQQQQQIQQGTLVHTSQQLEQEIISVKQDQYQLTNEEDQLKYTQQQEQSSFLDTSAFYTDEEIEYKLRMEQRELESAAFHVKSAKQMEEFQQKRKELEERQKRVNELIRQQKERREQQERERDLRNMQAEVKKQKASEKIRQDQKHHKTKKLRQKENSLTANINLQLQSTKNQGIRRKIQLDVYGDDQVKAIMKNQISDKQDLEARKQRLGQNGDTKKTFKKDHHVKAKKAVLHEEKIEEGDLDPDLQFMQDMLNNHKNANNKLFEKIRVVTKKNRKILTGKRLSISDSSDQQIMDFRKQMSKRLSMRLPGFFDNADLLDEINGGKYKDLLHHVSQQREEEQQEDQQLEKELFKDMFGDKKLEDLNEDEKKLYQEKLHKKRTSVKKKRTQKKLNSTFKGDISAPLSQQPKKKTTKSKNTTEHSYIEEEVEIQIEEIDKHGNKVKKTVKKKVKKLVSSNNKKANKKRKKTPVLSDDLKDSKMMNVQEITAEDLASGKYTQEELDQFKKIQDYKKQLLEQQQDTSEDEEEITIEQEILVEEEVEETVIGEDGIARKIKVKKQVVKKVPVKVQVKKQKKTGKKATGKKKKGKKKKKLNQDGATEDDDEDDDEDEEDEDEEEEDSEEQNTSNKSPSKKKRTKKQKNLRDSQDSQISNYDDYYDDSLSQGGGMKNSNNKYMKMKRRISGKDSGLTEEEKKKRLLAKQKAEEERRKLEEQKLKEQRALEEKKEKERQEKERKSRQLQNEIEKFKKFNVKDEMERIKSQNLNLSELKQEIERIIFYMGKNIDPELQFNIQAYNQRKEQLNGIRPNEEAQELERYEDKKTDYALQVLKNKARLFRNQEKEKKLKFSTSIEVPESGNSLLKGLKGKDISAEELKQIMKFQQLNDDLVKILERLVLFKEDTQFLEKLKLMCIEIDSIVVQKSIEQYNVNIRDKIESIQSLSKLSMRNSQIMQEDLIEENLLTPLQKLNKERYERLRQKKESHPELFNSFVQRCNNVKNDRYDVLKAVKHSQSTKNMLEMPNKRQIWDLNQPYNKLLMKNAHKYSQQQQLQESKLKQKQLLSFSKNNLSQQQYSQLDMERNISKSNIIMHSPSSTSMYK